MLSDASLTTACSGNLRTIISKDRIGTGKFDRQIKMLVWDTAIRFWAEPELIPKNFPGEELRKLGTDKRLNN